MPEQVWCHQPAKRDGHQAARSIDVTAKNARTGGAFSAPAHGRLGTLYGRISIGLWFWALDHAGTVNAPLCRVALATCFASRAERRRPLPVDARIPEPIFTSTHAITIDAPAERVWPWIAQMGAGRAGWYSWDAIDNGGTPSASRVVPELQTVVPGDVMPALPGATKAFIVASVDAPRDLVLTVPDGCGGNAVAWEHVLDSIPGGRTRLIVRGRASAHWLDLARAQPPAGHHRVFIERAYAALAMLPHPLLSTFATAGHRIMEARHLRGIQRRSTASRETGSTLERWRRVLLSCGVLASILYVAMTLFVGLLWDGYSVASNVPSELAAIGAPTRQVWLWLGGVYAALMVGFGWIVWKSAPPNRALRIVGALLMAHTVFGQFWPPMHQRAVLAAGGGTLTDTLHLVWAAVTGISFMLIVGFGAAALGKRFRLYSIATMVIVLACGAVTGTYASEVQADLPTPWVGVWERISIATFMAWIVVLAIALLRAPRGGAPSVVGGEVPGERDPLPHAAEAVNRHREARGAHHVALIGVQDGR